MTAPGPDTALQPTINADTWTPHEKQRIALQCPELDILFGGAVGGGKTDVLLAKWVQHQQRYGAAAVGLIVRRTMPELREILKRTHKLFPRLGAVWKASDKTWSFPNGAILIMGYLDTIEDAHKYWGWEFTFIGVDEVGHYKDPAPIDALRSRMRTTHPGVRLELFMTANPGGAGQDWLRKRYIDPAPPLTPHKDKETGLWRVYIPSWMTDNPNLMRDKSYVKRIKASGPTWLVRALIAGDWNVSVAGKIFMPEWWHWGNAGGQVHEQWKSGYLPPLRTVIQAWDTDFGKGNDNCAMVTLGIGHTRVYLLDWFEQSLMYPDLERQVIASASLWKPSAIIVEDKASGQSLLQSLREKTALPLVAGNKGDLKKEDHWLRNSAFVEAGRVGLFQDDPTAQVFANRLQACGTAAEHKDLADAFAYGLDYVRENYVFKPVDTDVSAPRRAPRPARPEADMPRPAPTGIKFSMLDLYRRR